MVSGESVTNIRYANDGIVMAACENELQATLNKINSTSNKYGMKLNATKTKVCQNSIN